MSTTLRERVRSELAAVAVPERAPGMQAYLKSSMPLLGVPSDAMRGACKRAFADVAFADHDAWRDAVLALWRGARHREERYAALELVAHRASKPFRTMEALPVYEELIVTGAWWDLVDGIATHRLGELLRAHPAAMKKTMLAWSRWDDLWKRRSSILCQIKMKKDTDLPLLYACIAPSLASKEFFLRKAIGWALRQYAWTDPEEVVRYVREHERELSGLSRREALKNVSRAPSR